MKGPASRTARAGDRSFAPLSLWEPAEKFLPSPLGGEGSGVRGKRSPSPPTPLPRGERGEIFPQAPGGRVGASWHTVIPSLSSWKWPLWRMWAANWPIPWPHLTLHRDTAVTPELDPDIARVRTDEEHGVRAVPEPPVSRGQFEPDVHWFMGPGMDEDSVVLALRGLKRRSKLNERLSARGFLGRRHVIPQAPQERGCGLVQQHGQPGSGAWGNVIGSGDIGPGSAVGCPILEFGGAEFWSASAAARAASTRLAKSNRE